MQPYLLAKAYAFRGMLLTRSFLEELAGSKNLIEFIDALKATPYSQEAHQITPPYTALKVEHALRRRLIKIHHRLMTIYKKNYLLAALYSRYIARDFKIILRGLSTGLKGEELNKLVDPYAEELMGTRDIIAKLLSVGSIEEALALIRLYTADEVVVPIFEKVSDPVAIEVEIDRWLINRLRGALRKTPKAWRQNLSHLIMPIYLRFVLTSILRGKAWELGPKEIGELVEDVLEGPLRSVAQVIIESNTIEEFKKAFTVMPKDTLPPISDYSTLNGIINSLERGYREMLLSRARRCFLRPFDEPSLTLAIVFLLDEEVAQLVALAAGIEQGVSSNELLGSIVSIA
ncbi:MAG: V-type ATPase subunit [Nitrososphaerota archaeon]